MPCQYIIIQLYCAINNWIIRNNLQFSGSKKKRKTQNKSKKRNLGCKRETAPACTSKKNVRTLQIQENHSKSCTNKHVKETLQGDTRNAAITTSKPGSGWSDLIPIELLLMIFLNVIKSIHGSSIPFLCRWGVSFKWSISGFIYFSFINCTFMLVSWYNVHSHGLLLVNTNGKVGS